MEKPILFNTEMVEAILNGRKTTTRRIIKDISGLDFVGTSSLDGKNLIMLRLAKEILIICLTQRLKNVLKLHIFQEIFFGYEKHGKCKV
ncbi:hypothetical protein [Clostridium botulinum]|uniref:hypothetical protein n=1 Tax=Clostridium botulinum TaxID=1491 RepID=UPI003AAE2B01